MDDKFILLASAHLRDGDNDVHRGEIHARHYASNQPVKLRWQEGTIAAIEVTAMEPENDRWVAPALFDLQVNGYAGVDFQRDGLSVGELLTAARALRTAGCARFLLTLVTDEWPKLTARLRHLRDLRSRSMELQYCIAGWHLEGPFLSQESGFHGAHDPALMLDPGPEHIHELRGITESDPLLLTLAPERKGALEMISLAVSLGIKVSLGHTNAPANILRQAVQAGATGFTHLGNACPQQLDRHDNVLWRALDTAGLMVSLIPDSVHVSPSLFRLIHRALGGNSICYTTDAMAAAGAPPGRYNMGALEIEVGPDRIVRQPGRGNYAGSALRPIDGVLRAAQMLDCSWREVWNGFSLRPAQFVSLDARLEIGAAADFCLLEINAVHTLRTLRTFVRGNDRPVEPEVPVSVR